MTLVSGRRLDTFILADNCRTAGLRIERKPTGSRSLFLSFPLFAEEHTHVHEATDPPPPARGIAAARLCALGFH
jgi:hypothetical protein